jgi:hypothetical protein
MHHILPYSRNLLYAGLLLSCCLPSRQVVAQTETTNGTPSIRATRQESKEIFARKGTFFAFWGYNRVAFTHSDIHCWGDGYDMNIYDVRATDEPSALGVLYIKPNGLTVPQFNLRAGYYLTDKCYVSLGTDHMKYIIAKQATRLNATITKGQNTGVYHDTEIEVGEGDSPNVDQATIADNLPKGFVSGFEHCDGLNDLSAEIGRIEQLWMSKNKKHALSVLGGAGLGAVIPDTDADILGQPPKHDMEYNKKAYHLAGWSASANMGLQFDFQRRIFLLFRVKAGYMNLPDILTTIYGGKAAQHFDFIEGMGVVGYNFGIHKGKQKSGLAK